MPTLTRDLAVSLDEARYRAGRSAFRNAGKSESHGHVGLEQEYLTIVTDSSGTPVGRLPLGGPQGAYERLDQHTAHDQTLIRRATETQTPREFALRNGGRLTFEPGGQIEHSTAVHSTVQAALEDVSDVRRHLAEAIEPSQAVLAGAGLDVWNDIEDIPLQLDADRYVSMTEFFGRRGPWGRLMMRHTGSLQVNLDFGPEGVWQERWTLANLMAPVVLGIFANSPGYDGVSMRARAWQGLDPTRTGFPEFPDTSDWDPRDQYAEAALDADVMLVRASDGRWVSGRPGFSFRRWIEEGHAELGWPTVDDLEYHLTTVFFEVRPKGFLELRTCESLPDRWRAAPVVLTAAMLYDNQARIQGLQLLDGLRNRLPQMWSRAAEWGIRDDEIAGFARRLWEIALAGAERLPRGYVGGEALATAREFSEDFTLAGRMPADMLTELQGDPAKSLAWAAGSGNAPVVPLPNCARSFRSSAASSCAFRTA